MCTDMHPIVNKIRSPHSRRTASPGRAVFSTAAMCAKQSGESRPIKLHAFRVTSYTHAYETRSEDG
ncbi:hypothetical protein C8Q80DRAFT_1212151 [Daedaleopsis nitida]|nr:hypothetical protein C8Q80DRAFT_1212151 [Daedaleopsis nitida]